MVKGIGEFVRVGNGCLKMDAEVKAVERDEENKVTGTLVQSFHGVTIYVKEEDVDSGMWTLESYSSSSSS